MIVYKGQGIYWHPQSDSLEVSPLKRTWLTHPLISSSHCLVESLRQLTCFIGCFTVCLISLVMCMVTTNTQLSKWRRLSTDHAGMTSSGNPDCLTSQNHKCLAIFPAPLLCHLLTLLYLPLLLIERMTLNSYAMKGVLIWLHFWCQRQSPYRLFLQKPSLFVNGLIGTFLSYLL